MKLLLADDHTLFRAGMKRLLADLGDFVEISEARDGAEVLRLVGNKSTFDLLLLDLNMPGIDGLEMLATLRRHSPETPVVIMSADDTPATVRTIMAGGASGFISKSVQSEVMLNALRLVMAGGVYLPPTVLLPEIQTASKAALLTSRQREVLSLIEHGKSNKEIGRALGLTEGTIKQHVSTILRVLKASNRMRAVMASKQVSGNKI